MKKGILMSLIVLASFTVFGQSIIGKWNGSLNIQGAELRIAFNIAATGGSYTSTMDSPDQGAFGIPVIATSFESGVLKIDMANLGIQYTGTLDKENVIVGNFKQGGQSFPLNLSQATIVKPMVVRPQVPTKPYPYYEEEVVFENKTDNITLAGTLTLPTKEGNYPVVVMITGSGPQNRDEELLGHKPFLIIADYLTRNGIAVLRFDDRGVAQSKGDFSTATSINFATDVESAVAYLQTRKEINKQKIGLVGHSEGGIIAPMVAAKCKDVIFIVLLAGIGIPGSELLIMQKELIEKAAGVSEADIQKGCRINKGAFDIVSKSKDTDKLKEELTAYYKLKLKENPEIKPADMSEDAFVNSGVKQLSNPWMHFFIGYNPYLILKDVKCPVLALNGQKDLQVPPAVNLAAIKKGLEEGGNKNVTTMELPNLNHLFQECTTGAITEYATIEQTISPVALAAMSDWIQLKVK